MHSTMSVICVSLVIIQLLTDLQIRQMAQSMSMYFNLNLSILKTLTLRRSPQLKREFDHSVMSRCGIDCEFLLSHHILCRDGSHPFSMVRVVHGDRSPQGKTTGDWLRIRDRGIVHWRSNGQPSRQGCNLRIRFCRWRI